MIATASDFEIAPAPARGLDVGISLALFLAVLGGVAVACDVEGWGFRTWRRDRYLANNPAIPAQLFR